MSKSAAERLDQSIRDKLVVLANGGTAATLRQLWAAGARDILHLTSVSALAGRHHTAPYKSSSRVGANNCQVAIVCGAAAGVLRARRFFQRFETIFIPSDASLAIGALGLVRYRMRGCLRYRGSVRLEGIRAPLLMFENTLQARGQRPRIYGPDRKTPLEIMRSIADLDAVLLRWFETVEQGGPLADLDILASPSASTEIVKRLQCEAGTFPIDLYTTDGSGNRTYKSIPYFPPAMANQIVDSAQTQPSGIKVASTKWRYLSYAFHLMFHKSYALQRGTTTFDRGSFAKGEYFDELQRLARHAGMPEARSIQDLETALRDAGVFPEPDTIGFYSEGNLFLADYLARSQKVLAPGLGVFIVRDFGLHGDFVAAIRERITLKGFEILVERPILRDEDAVIRHIRGGNWIDEDSPGGLALPIHAFVVFDPSPIRNCGVERQRYPRVDNKKLLIKRDMRNSCARESGLKKANIIHASDNSVEAEAYIRALGLKNVAAVDAVLNRLVGPVAT